MINQILLAVQRYAVAAIAIIFGLVLLCAAVKGSHIEGIFVIVPGFLLLWLGAKDNERLRRENERKSKLAAESQDKARQKSD